jgi:hypothetical protein
MLVALPTIPFDRLKAHLVTDHLLTDVQQMEKVWWYQQWVSRGLQNYWLRCPRGEKSSVFFNCLFLQKLPPEMRILLSEADMGDKRLLGDRADQVWAQNAQQHHDTGTENQGQPN